MRSVARRDTARVGMASRPGWFSGLLAARTAPREGACSVDQIALHVMTTAHFSGLFDAPRLRWSARRRTR